jgi:hypothetical protein
MIRSRVAIVTVVDQKDSSSVNEKWAWFVWFMLLVLEQRKYVKAADT